MLFKRLAPLGVEPFPIRLIGRHAGFGGGEFAGDLARAGEWNRYTLTLKDRHLTVDFNGERTIVLDLAASPMKDRPVDGHIGFQDEAKRVWYRNVRIKELK